jgi:hypothetical protein
MINEKTNKSMETQIKKISVVVFFLRGGGSEIHGAPLNQQVLGFQEKQNTGEEKQTRKIFLYTLFCHIIFGVCFFYFLCLFLYVQGVI